MAGPAGFGSGYKQFGVPFFTGATGGGTVTTLDVPAKFDVALGGFGYMIDTEFAADYRRYWSTQSVPVQRQQFDSQDTPGEHTLSSEDYWRRSAAGFAGGAGQSVFDRPASDTEPGSSPNRYRTSKGIYPFGEQRFTLVNDTERKKSSSNSLVLIVTVGSYVYCLDGSTLSRTSDPTGSSPTFTTITTSGTAISSATSLASDGFNVWVCDGTDLYYTTTGGTTYSAWHSGATGARTLIRYAKSRLFSAQGATLYVHGAQGTAAPSAYYTHPTSAWTWVDVAEGPNAIYFAGYAGDKSVIYRTALVDTTSTLSAPVQAGELPDGEIVRSIQGYLGFLLIGTDSGFRFASTDASGNLILGDLANLGVSVRCFEPQDRFVWFGWTNFDGTSSGLGRVDLRTLNATTPAYSSDLMATAQGTVSSVITFGTRRYFTIASSGVWGETANRVSSGTLYTGTMDFDVTPKKDAVSIEVASDTGAGTYTVSVSADAGTYTAAGGTVTTSTGAAMSTLPISATTAGTNFQVLFTLNRDSNDNTSAPVITRWTLLAEPIVRTRRIISVPLIISYNVTARGSGKAHYVPLTERNRFSAWRDDGTHLSYQESDGTYTVKVRDWQWFPHQVTTQGQATAQEGTLLVTLMTLDV